MAELTIKDGRTLFDFDNGRGFVPAHYHINPDGSQGGIVADSAEIGSNVYIEADALISTNALISADVHIGVGVYIGFRVQLGKRAKIGEGVKIESDTQIGDDTQIGGDTQIGADAQIGDYVQIGADAQIGNRARIGDGAKIGDHGIVTIQPIYLSGMDNYFVIICDNGIGIGGQWREFKEWEHVSEENVEGNSEEVFFLEHKQWINSFVALHQQKIAQPI